MGAIADFLKRMRDNRSGNALMMVAAGMPALIGGAGFAVDMTQWYMWKAELQYAVDQAALAGAYARASDATEALYETRAEQEYAANLSKTVEFASDPDVELQDWATGKDNSVVVTASATKSLPFSSFLTGSATTVAVSAQAAFEKGMTYSSCLIAVDEDEEGAVTIGGSAEFIAGCGIAALSDDPLAIKVNGSPTIEAGWLIAKGGIDDWFDTNTTDTVLEGQEGLFDPFGCDDEGKGACLSPPTNNTAQTYACPKGKTSTSFIADSVTTRTQITYTYYKKRGNDYDPYNYTGSYKQSNVDTTTTATDVTLAALPTTNPETTNDDSGYVWRDGSGNDKTYERAIKVVTKTYVNARAKTTSEEGGAAVIEPGTYTDLTLKCDTVMKGGIYVIDGGSFVTHAQHNLTGSGVMIVLKNGAGIQINGGANINLTAMTITELQAAGLTYENAVKLAGMLIFEDPNSSGNTGNKLNGNAMTVLNGTVYLPVSNLDVQGSAGVTSQCLMLVASTITLTGNVAMESFCPIDRTEDTTILTTKDRVRLVS